MLSLRLILLFTLALVWSAPAFGQSQEGGKDWIFVGTYTGKGSKGIYRLELDRATGKLSSPVLAAEIANPTFLAIHPNGRFLYCINEVYGKKGGGVTAFALDPTTGKLTFLNQQTSIGTGPCHITVDQKGKFALAANYGSGSVLALPIGPDGKLGEASSFIQHKGKSVNPGRQEGPHAHSINLDPKGRFALAADLGLDNVFVYRFDDKGKLTANDPPAGILAPGAGPRHLTFDKQGKNVFVVNELNSTVTVFAFNDQTGEMKETQTITTLPKDSDGKKNYPAEIRLHPSEKFLYASNRGANSNIAIFRVECGKLTPVGHQNHLVQNPRNFSFDTSGRFLLVGSQDTGKVIVFDINQKTGELTPNGVVAEVSSPVCIRALAK